MKSKNLQIEKRDKVLLFLAGITAVVFSAMPEKSREIAEHVYLLCVLSPVLFWWVLDGTRRER
jgi:hypothetical protein